jgi:hypothetical protein
MVARPAVPARTCRVELRTEAARAAGGYFSGGGGAIGPGNSDSNPLGGGGGGGTSWANPTVVSGSVTYTTNGFQSDGFVRITFE